MRCLIHDFAGHPFQAQLSRELARRSHYVTHYRTIGLDGPKGRLDSSQTDPGRLSIRGVPLSGAFRQWRFVENTATRNPPQIAISSSNRVRGRSSTHVDTNCPQTAKTRQADRRRINSLQAE